MLREFCKSRTSRRGATPYGRRCVSLSTLHSEISILLLNPLQVRVLSARKHRKDQDSRARQQSTGSLDRSTRRLHQTLVFFRLHLRTPEESRSRGPTSMSSVSSIPDTSRHLSPSSIQRSAYQTPRRKAGGARRLDSGVRACLPVYLDPSGLHSSVEARKSACSVHLLRSTSAGGCTELCSSRVSKTW